MRISQILQFLPFWGYRRPDYFTHGVADGKAAAVAIGVKAPADAARVGEQALLAAHALPGRVESNDVRVYCLGWIEGYKTGSAASPAATGQ